MQDIGNIIAQLTAAQSSLSPTTPAQGQSSASSANGTGNGNQSQSFQSTLNNVSQPSGSGQSSGSAQSGQVLPPAQNNTQNVQNSATNSQSLQASITGNPGFARLANLLGNIVQQQKQNSQSQAASQATSNSAPQSTTDNLLINGKTGQGSQTNITSPEALLQFMMGRNAANAALLASNNNSSGNTNTNNSTTQPTTQSAVPSQQQQSSNQNDPTSLASILAQINPVHNFVANSQAAANASNQTHNLSINPNASSGSGLAKALAAQTATAASQQNQPNSDTASNTNSNANNKATAPNLQAIDTNQKAVFQNFALAFANNTLQGQSAKPTTKLVSESKLPDFSNFSNQVFAVKTDTKSAVQASSALNNAANEENNNNINNAIAALDKPDDQLKSDTVKEDETDTVDAADAAQQLQAKTDSGAVKTTTVSSGTTTPDTVKYQTPAEQVVFQVAAAAKDGNSKIRIQLEPSDLGKIEVQMNMNSDGKLNLNITADKSSTLTMLQGDSKSLEKSLNDIGFKSDATNLSFNLRQGSNGGQPQNWTYQNYGTTSTSNQDTAEVTAYSALPSMLTSNQALDIRV